MNQDDPYGFRSPRFRVPPVVHADSDLQRHDPPHSKAAYPYSYDPFTIWGKPAPNPKCDSSVYTDRLEQRDYAKCERLRKKHYTVDGVGQSPFSSQYCRGDLIQNFLRDWYDNPKLELVRVIEYVHLATGFPLWRLDSITHQES